MTTIECKIECKNETIIYRSLDRSFLKEKTGKIICDYPSYVVTRLIHGVTNDLPVLCLEMSNMGIFRNFLGTIKNLFVSIDEWTIAPKWICDLYQLEDWINNFQIQITSSFTKTNKNRSSTIIRITFPYKPHKPETETKDETKEVKEVKDKVKQETKMGNHSAPLPQHCYQFVYKCLAESLPGAKSGPLDGKYFDFTFKREKYETRSQIENVVDEFISKYKANICDKEMMSIGWNINKVDTYFQVK